MNIRVLVAEDTIIDREILLYMLVNEFQVNEHEIIVVENGPEALNELHENMIRQTQKNFSTESICQPYDLLIIDYHLPLMNGLEVIK